MLHKCKKDAMVFGVCAGLAEYLGMDKTLVRLLMIVGTIFSLSLAFWFYIILAIILPDEHQ